MNEARNLTPCKTFCRNLIDKRILAKVAELLQDDVPANVRIVLMKCLVNSCVEGYKLERDNDDNESAQNCSHEADKSLSGPGDREDNFPSFPYNGITTWAAERIIKYVQNPCECSKDEYEILRLATQFLCNLVTFACERDNLPCHLKSGDFKTAIM